jgi:hypothetical protein
VNKARGFALFAVFVLNTCAWVALTAPPAPPPLASQTLPADNADRVASVR